MRALGNQTKLSTFDTVAFRVRRRPDRFHALRRAPSLHSSCQKFGNTDYFLKIPAKAKMRCSMKHGRQPSNQLRGAQDAAAHACSTGLSTGRRLMPMTARCGAAAPCRGATTVRQLQHTRRVVERAQSACSCSCMRGHGRKLSCIGMRGCGRKRKGVDENSWQSRQLHRRVPATNQAMS